MKKIFALILAFACFPLAGCRDGGEIEISALESKAYDDGGKLVVPRGYIILEIFGKDGEIIIDAVCVKYKENLSVADISRAACRDAGIPIIFSGVGTMLYVRGINGLFEFDHGAESGWIYFVNGESQGVSCGAYILSDGDYVNWSYTLDFGEDLGAHQLAE